MISVPKGGKIGIVVDARFSRMCLNADGTGEEGEYRGSLNLEPYRVRLFVDNEYPAFIRDIYGFMGGKYEDLREEIQKYVTGVPFSHLGDGGRGA
jgi:hypothetical protein